MVNASTLIGVVLVARHGDRSSTVYQSPTTYESVQGYLTPFGAVRLTQDLSIQRAHFLHRARNINWGSSFGTPTSILSHLVTSKG